MSKSQKVRLFAECFVNFREIENEADELLLPKTFKEFVTELPHCPSVKLKYLTRAPPGGGTVKNLSANAPNQAQSLSMLTTAEWNPGNIIGVSYVDIPPLQDPTILPTRLQFYNGNNGHRTC